jgi:hypothetical protein
MLCAAFFGLPILMATMLPEFAGSLDAYCASRGIPSLRATRVANGSFESRIWIGFGLAPLECIQLKRDGLIWSGHYYRDGVNSHPPQERIIRPMSGWTTFWKKLDSLGFAVLPDSRTLKGEKLVFDGESYVVEIMDGSRYRTYEYSNPSEQSWPEAKMMVDIIAVVRSELIRQDSMPNQSTDPTLASGTPGAEHESRHR